MTSNWDITLESSNSDFGKKYNPSENYETPQINYSERDKILIKVIQKAVKNGWTGWRIMVNDAVTQGLEAESVLKGMKRHQKPIEPLIFNKEFNKFLWGEGDLVTARYEPPEGFKKLWQYHIQEMVISEDPINYLGEKL